MNKIQETFFITIMRNTTIIFQKTNGVDFRRYLMLWAL